MPFKTITIKKSTFEKIRKEKMPGESFTALFERKFNSPDLSRFVGLWKDIPDKDIEKMKKNIRRRRKEIDGEVKRDSSRHLRSD